MALTYAGLHCNAVTLGGQPIKCFVYEEVRQHVAYHWPCIKVCLQKVFVIFYFVFVQTSLWLAAYSPNIPYTCWGEARHAYYSEHNWPFRKQSVDVTANPIEIRGLRIVYLGYSPYPLTHHPGFQCSHQASKTKRAIPFKNTLQLPASSYPVLLNLFLFSIHRQSTKRLQSGFHANTHNSRTYLSNGF